MTATSITMYETAGAAFSRIPFQRTTTLTTGPYWDQSEAPRPIEWRDHVTARLAELERLAPNWDGDGGLPVSRQHANRAINFLVRLIGSSLAPVPVPDVVPLADGGVQLEWHTASTRRVDFVSDEESEPMVLVQEADQLREFSAQSVDVAELRARLGS